MTYDRRKDTSYLKRSPLTLDRTAGDSEKEQMERPSVVDTDRKKLTLKDILRTIMKNNSAVNDIDTRRLDNINNLDNLHKLRQIVRNRTQQVHNKIIHTEDLQEVNFKPFTGSSKDMGWEKEGGIRAYQHGGHPVAGGMKAIQVSASPEKTNVTRLNDDDKVRRKANWEEDAAKAKAKGKPAPPQPRYVQSLSTTAKLGFKGIMPGVRKTVTKK